MDSWLNRWKWLAVIEVSQVTTTLGSLPTAEQYKCSNRWLNWLDSALIFLFSLLLWLTRLDHPSPHWYHHSQTKSLMIFFAQRQLYCHFKSWRQTFRLKLIFYLYDQLCYLSDKAQSNLFHLRHCRRLTDTLLKSSCHLPDWEQTSNCFHRGRYYVSKVHAVLFLWRTWVSEAYPRGSKTCKNLKQSQYWPD